MYGMELMRLLVKEAKMEELMMHKFEDGTVLALFRGDGKYLVALFDTSDIEIWEEEFYNEDEAKTEYHKRLAEGPLDKRVMR